MGETNFADMNYDNEIESVRNSFIQKPTKGQTKILLDMMCDYFKLANQIVKSSNAQAKTILDTYKGVIESMQQNLQTTEISQNEKYTVMTSLRLVLPKCGNFKQNKMVTKKKFLIKNLKLL